MQATKAERRARSDTIPTTCTNAKIVPNGQTKPCTGRNLDLQYVGLLLVESDINGQGRYLSVSGKDYPDKHASFFKRKTRSKDRAKLGKSTLHETQPYHASSSIDTKTLHVV